MSFLARAYVPTLAPRTEHIRNVSCWLLAAAYLFVGAAHLRAPSGFVAITPDWVPYPYRVVVFTGLCEIAGATGLMIPRLRWWAGVMLAAYAVCVYPANIKHAVDNIAIGGRTLGWAYHLPRLMLQPAIVWWALFAGRVVDWPFGRRRSGG